MRNKKIVLFAMMLIIPAMLFAVSCSKKNVDVQPEPVADQVTEEQPAVQDTTDADRAAEEAKRIADAELARQKEREQMERQMAQDKYQFVSKDIHFDFDSAALTPEAQQLLNGKVDFLTKYANIDITVEGHCDERGTEAYNLALGERRADAVKAYLVNLGVPEHRFTTISYGEERPVNYGHYEEAWAQNRRAHLTIE